jgi:hypothetical protein
VKKKGKVPAEKQKIKNFRKASWQTARNNIPDNSVLPDRPD